MDKPLTTFTMAGIMSKNPTTVTREARLTDAGSLMAEKNIGAVVVVGPQGEVLFHEGRIWGESAEGEFARFIFTIPKNESRFIGVCRPQEFIEFPGNSYQNERG